MDSFTGPYESFRTFFHGHSFTGNQLGSAAALANLDILESQRSQQHRQKLEEWFRVALNALWESPYVGDIRRAGLIAGIELVADRSNRRPFDLTDRVGIRVCEALAARGVLTRPIGNVLVLMPIYTTTKRQLTTIVTSTKAAIQDILGS